MSINHFIFSEIEPKYDIYVNDITLEEEGKIKNAKVEVDNGDIVDFSSLASYGAPSERLTSLGNGQLAWVAGAGTSGIEYGGVVPLTLNTLAKYSATDGSVVDKTSFVDSDIVLKDGSVAMTGNLDLNSNDIINVSNLTSGVINCLTINSTDVKTNRVFLTGTLDMTTNNINNVNILDVDNIQSSQPSINVNTPIDMNVNNIERVNDLETSTISALTSSINMVNNVSLSNNDITNCNLLGVDNIQSINLIDDIVIGSNVDMFQKEIKNCLNITTTDLNTDTISANAPATSVLMENDVTLGSNDINNIGSMTITATQYLSKVSDFGAPVGNYYVIPDNTTWIILGQITLQYGIQFGVNCSLRGIDFSAQITFDESVRDCDIKTLDNNFYLSQLTIVNGGGRFTGNTTLVRGLLNAQNYNLGAPAPFYGRNKRFKITDCNILRAFKIGTVEGFGTLNITNNFFNGGGGLAGQATSYYTNEGISVSDGLSLEMNNNKMVLMLGAQQVSTAKLLNMKARVSPLLGFNATVITGNVIHPRNSETGIDFDADSRTELGNISGNVFIRTGGTSPLINYTDQPTYDNYNPLSIENYSVNANTGVVDSEPNLKSAIGTSNVVTDINPASSEIVPSDNSQVLQIESSARFAVQLDLTGVTVAFVANERITDTASGNTALILAVDTEAGGLQSVYITDMDGTFDATPTTFTSATGNATGGSLTFRYRYSEKDPRKLVTVATFTISTGNNEQYFVAPGNGVPDVACEVSGIANNAGVGGTVSASCTRRFADGDIINFFLSSAGGSNTSIDKGIINIK